MSALTPCPLCGAEYGYHLEPGSTFRWLAVLCGSCDELVAECRATLYDELGSELEPTSEVADEAWNAAGAYASSLSQRINALESWVRKEAQEHVCTWEILGEPCADCTCGRAQCKVAPPHGILPAIRI